MKKFLTATQIAKLEDVTRPAVSGWIRLGVFPGTRKVGREYRVPIDSYHAWRESTKDGSSDSSDVRPNVRTSVRTDAKSAAG